MATHYGDKSDLYPEATLAKMFKDDIAIEIDPKLLRLFIRWRWNEVRRLAHLIHGSTTP